MKHITKLTIKEVATKYNISRQAVWKWIKTGKVKAERKWTPGKKPVWVIDERNLPE